MKLKRTTKSVQSTVYHEAGHAVAASVQGLPTNKVTIRETQDFWGQVTHPSVLMLETSGKRDQNQVVRQYVIMLYAGFEAERCFNPDADEALFGGDFDQAWNLPREFRLPIRGCSYIGDEVYQGYLERLRKQARSLVRKHWGLIRILAQELLERKTMTGKEVEDLITRERGEIN